MMVLMIACRPGESHFVDRSDVLPGGPPVFHSGAEGGYFLPEIMGGGVGLFDADGDGDLDILVLNGGRLAQGRPTEADDGAGPWLFRNDGGWRFTDVSERSGLPERGYNMGLAVADVDADGDIDLYFANYGQDRLFVNDGTGRFEDATAAAGISVDGWSSSATFLDFDGDDDPDLYVVRYVDFDPPQACRDHLGRSDYCGPQNFEPQADLLLLNDGQGGFRDVSRERGIAAKALPGLGVVTADFDADGRLDVYVANDATANMLWRSSERGAWEEEAIVMGAAFNSHGGPQAGMGTAAADLDRDGWLDILVTNLTMETNAHYRNRAEAGGFEDVALTSGVGSSSFPSNGFGVLAMDLELDGDLDLVMANGDVRVHEGLETAADAPEEEFLPWSRYAQPNQVMINEGGDHFEPMDIEDCGPLCREKALSRGLARGDLDGDGDLDLVVGNVEGPFRVYENRMPRKGRWLRLRLVSGPGGGDAIGARAILLAGQDRWTGTLSLSDGYLSSSEPWLHFGLPDRVGLDGVIVHWPTGNSERFELDCLDCSRVLRRGEGEDADGMSDAQSRSFCSVDRHVGLFEARREFG